MSISTFAYSNNIAQAFFDNNDEASGVLIAVKSKSKSSQELIEPASKAAGSIYGINYQPRVMLFVEACD